MGIWGLTSRARKYSKRISTSDFADYNESFVYIDAPAFAFYICNSSLTSYSTAKQDTLKIVELVLKLTESFKSVCFYFDGKLPESKIHVRLERSAKLISQTRTSPLYSPLLLYKVLEDYFPSTQVKLVRGEADDQIAYEIGRDSQCNPNGRFYIMSNDSDFLTYRFESKSIFLMTLNYCDFEQSSNLLLAVTRISDVYNILGRREHKVVPMSGLEVMPKEFEMPKVSEIFNSMNVERKLRPVSYLLIFDEYDEYTPSWEAGKTRMYRSLSYSLLLSKYGNYYNMGSWKPRSVIEYYQIGPIYGRKPLEIFLPKLEYALLTIPLSTRTGLIEEITSQLADPDEFHFLESKLREYLTLVLTSTDVTQNYELDIHYDYSEKPKLLVQLFSNLQATLYTLMLLQASGIKLGVIILPWHADWSIFKSIMET
jgi:hypothetical protein